MQDVKIGRLLLIFHFETLKLKLCSVGTGIPCTPFSEMNENTQKSLISITFFCIYLVIPISFCTFAAEI